MVHCVSDTCREELDQKWNFCPFCGMDNRPPEYRPRIRNCRHEFVKVDGYCIDCGRRSGENYEAASRSLQVKLGLTGIVLGVLTLVATFLIYQIHAQGHGPGYDWIRTWYDQTYLAHGKYGNTYVRQRGADTLTWMGLIGFLLTFGGIATFFPDTWNYGRRRYDSWS